MKKIIWIVGSPMGDFSKQLNMTRSGSVWCVKLCNQIKEYRSDISLHVICAVSNKNQEMNVNISNINYYGVYSPNNYKKYSSKFTNKTKKIIETISPDIIHLWGTENEYSYSSFKAIEQLGMLDHTVVSIQGLVSVIYKHYTTCLPAKVVYSYTFRDFLKQSNIHKEAYGFKKRGIYEEYVLKNAVNVIGRTKWDYMCSNIINKKLKYFVCNETLRNGFYHENWDIHSIKRHSIFMSGSSYPVKGVHIMLEALKIIKKYYPDTCLYTPGKDRKTNNKIEKIKFGGYDKYLAELIKRYNLNDNVFFLGELSEKQMIENYLSANVFVSSSTIENSSNAIGEAMILGVPVVASCVGGIQSLMKHGEEGMMYQADAPYMLAYYVMEIFKNDQLALKLSMCGKKRALETHNPNKNFNDLIKIYTTISEDEL